MIYEAIQSLAGKESFSKQITDLAQKMGADLMAPLPITLNFKIDPEMEAIDALNPASLELWSDIFGIQPHLSFLEVDWPTGRPSSFHDDYRSLRASQNKEWALQSLAEGKEFEASGFYERALRCYTNAIEIYCDFIEALVCRAK
ncbi:hypothetical protein HMI55_003979, partial [Coelomomyces lativittatus]